ncbi:MAG: DUF4296 domain-containing protein [Prevotellaceae bacterium]|nr:DUF4296 domain-containing protein [Prevotellaceae bacterium]
MRRGFCLSLIVFLAAACTVGVPHWVIPQGKMERILYDYHLAQGMAEASGGSDPSTDRSVLVAQVFAKYGISEEDFDTSMVWYSAHSERLVEMYQHVDDRIQREAASLGVDAADDVYAHLTSYGDTALIWTTTNVCLRNTATGNLETYTIHADSTFMPGDTYALRFKSRFVTEDGRQEGYALLIARYEGDTLASVTSRMGGDFETNIEIAQSALTDTARLTLLQVVFYFPYDETNRSQFRLWMARQPMLIRFRHTTEELAPEDEEEQADTISNTQGDTLQGEQPSGERLSPRQMRDSHEGERTINVTKQRRVVLPPQRNRNQRRK